jgi:hypothetical protein
MFACLYSIHMTNQQTAAFSKFSSFNVALHAPYESLGQYPRHMGSSGLFVWQQDLDTRIAASQIS